jgi:hypothetical protein
VDADRLDGLDSSEFPHTPQQVVDLVKQADGSGSGVDADRLDGLDNTQFMRADHDTGTVGAVHVGGALDVTGLASAHEVRIAAGSHLGVGVDNPLAEVHVNGTVRAKALMLEASQQPPANPVPGMIYFAANDGLQIFDGQNWVPLANGGNGAGQITDYGNGGDGGLVVNQAGTVVNTYTFLTGDARSGADQLAVDSTQGFHAGDEVLVVQMQGAGAVAGRHVFRRVAGLDNGRLRISPALDADFTSGTFDRAGASATQVVRVPNFTTVVVNGSITAPAWNGRVGGIVALRASDSIRFAANATINVDGRGFRGPALERVRGVNGRVGEGVWGNSGTRCADQNTAPDTGTGGCGAVEGSVHSQDGVAAAGGGANEAPPPADGFVAGGRFKAQEGAVHRPGDFQVLVLGGGGGQGDVGSNDWTSAAKGGDGGGAVFLSAPTISDAVVYARGGAGQQGCDYFNSGGDWGVSGGGGGAGGTIAIKARNVANAQLVATGGAGGDICGHAGIARSSSGGPGRVRVDADQWQGTAVPEPRDGAGRRFVGPLVVNGDGNVLNSYAYVTANVVRGNRAVPIGGPGGFAVGDEVLIVQVQGPGLVPGAWELKRVAAVAADHLDLADPLDNDYVSGAFDQGGARAAEVVRVAEYTTLTVNGAVVAPPWNGRFGGIVALRARDAVQFGAAGQVNVDGAGFRGPARENVRNVNGRVGEGVYGNSGTRCNNENTDSDTGTGGCGAVEGSYHSQDGVAAAGGGANEANPPGNGHPYPGRYRAHDGRAYRAGDYRILTFGGGGGGGDVGSNDWTSASKGGNGGGLAVMLAPVIRNPRVFARGAGGERACDYFGSGGDWGVSGGGGGAGGTIFLQSPDVTGGQLLATGGPGETICGHEGQATSGSGGNGRVRVTAGNFNGQSTPAAQP